MRRSDLAGFAGWGRHTDPLFAHYDVRPLEGAEADAFWRALAGAPAQRRPYAALEDGVLAGSLVVRPRPQGAGDIGIVLDPARIGRGLGRRILAAFAAVLADEGFRRLRLDVAAYNRRAIAAYRAAGFVAGAERWDVPEPGLDVEALLEGPSAAALAPFVDRTADGRYRMRVVAMERRLTPPMKVES
jgi:RimJ/RimL family protein N-acetyltransferase